MSVENHIIKVSFCFKLQKAVKPKSSAFQYSYGKLYFKHVLSWFLLILSIPVELINKMSDKQINTINSIFFNKVMEIVFQTCIVVISIINNNEQLKRLLWFFLS